MKKIIFYFLILLFFEGNAQITEDFQCQFLNLRPVKINTQVTKYFSWGQISEQFTLYNLDGSVYKTVQIPPKPDPNAYYINGIQDISESLFDTDSSNIEYMVEYQYDSLSSSNCHRVKVIREDGTILLDELNASIPWSVYSTEDGAKLMLNYVWAASYQYYQTKVFSLPGELPLIVDKYPVSEINTPQIYPNLNNGDFRIDMNFKNEASSTLELYNSTGELVRSYNLSELSKQINEPSLQNGLYLVNIKTDGIQHLKKMIIQK